jgi:hypothetical protein
VRGLRLWCDWWCQLAIALSVVPELNQLQARLSALMPFRVAAGELQHLLPIDAGKSPETLRSHTATGT